MAPARRRASTGAVAAGFATAASLCLFPTYRIHSYAFSSNVAGSGRHAGGNGRGTGVATSRSAIRSRASGPTRSVVDGEEQRVGAHQVCLRSAFVGPAPETSQGRWSFTTSLKRGDLIDFKWYAAYAYSRWLSGVNFENSKLYGTRKWCGPQSRIWQLSLVRGKAGFPRHPTDLCMTMVMCKHSASATYWVPTRSRNR